MIRILIRQSDEHLEPYMKDGKIFEVNTLAEAQLEYISIIQQIPANIVSVVEDIKIDLKVDFTCTHDGPHSTVPGSGDNTGTGGNCQCNPDDGIKVEVVPDTPQTGEGTGNN